MKNLISMVDFVLEQSKRIAIEITFMEYSEIIINYANFLKQPLELWMFVPCKLVDGVWVVLEERLIENYETDFGLMNDFENYNKKYYQAKERCLFVWQKGFDYKVICEMFKDLEDIILFEFELTETAQKQIFG